MPTLSRSLSGTSAVSEPMDANDSESIQQSSAVAVAVCSDWDQPFTEEELESIEAIIQSASSSSSSSSRIERCRSSGTAAESEGGRPKARRRLPDSLFNFRGQPTFADNSLSGCNPMGTLNVSPLWPCLVNQSSKPSSTSNRAKLKMSYPCVNFGGDIVYSSTASEVEKAAGELLQFVESKKKDGCRAVLGFDIEWKPTFKKGVKAGKAAVMQICVDNRRCHVMHIIHSGFPQNLLSLLRDHESLKVGVGIAGDARKVFRDHNVTVEALEDLSRLANLKLDGEPKSWGLASLTERLICKQLAKPSKIKLGDWETIPLSKKQLKYAATDAFISWYLYEVLKGLPDAVAHS